MGEGEMLMGKVKWFDLRRGFGFIVDHLGRDVFVHFSVIEGEGFRKLVEGEKVAYRAVDRPGGLCAVVVRRAVEGSGEERRK